jgi:hypothetical protein
MWRRSTRTNRTRVESCSLRRAGFEPVGPEALGMSGCAMHEDSNSVAASTIKFRELVFTEPLKKQCLKQAKHVQAEKHH